METPAPPVLREEHIGKEVARRMSPACVFPFQFPVNPNVVRRSNWQLASSKSRFVVGAGDAAL